jgi:hypothetical protein
MNTTCLIGVFPGTIVPPPPVEPPVVPVPAPGPVAAVFPPVGRDALVSPTPLVVAQASAPMTTTSKPRNAANPRRRAERRLEKRRRLLGIREPGREGPEDELMAA